MGYDASVEKSYELEDVFLAYNRTESSIKELFETEEGVIFWRQHSDSIYMDFDLAESSYSNEKLKSYKETKGINPYVQYEIW